MISVLADGEERHRLEDVEGRSIGWIRQKAVGFRGFPTERDAMRAAVDAWGALQRVLQREYAGWPRHEPALDRLRLVHDGAYEWISDGARPLARLHRPKPASSSDTFAIELVLPSFATEGVAVSAAQVIAHALDGHAAAAA